MNLPCHHRHLHGPIFAEARLCHVLEGAGEIAGFAAGWVARNVGVGLIVDLPRGMYNGLRRAFGTEVTEPANRERLRRAHEFLTNAPRRVAELVARQLDRPELTLTPQQVENLTSHAEWIRAINDIGPDQPVDGSAINQGNCTPTEIMRRQSQQNRRRIFVDYAQTMLSADVRNRFTGNFGGVTDTADAFTGNFTVEANRRNVLDAMHVVSTGRTLTGVAASAPTLDATVRDIAKKELSQHYFEIDPATGAPRIVGGRKQLKAPLIPDLGRAFLVNPNATTTAELKLGLEPSRMKAALELDVVENADLVYLRPAVEKWRTDRAAAELKTSALLNRYMGASRREIMRNNDTLTQRFTRLPFFIKVLLGYIGWRFVSNNPGPTTGIAALLGGMYFFGRRNSPVSDIGSFLTSIAGVGAGPFQQIARDMGMPVAPHVVNSAEIDRRARAFVQFLSEHSRSVLTAAVPLAAVADIDMALLARTYVPPTGADTVGNFKVDDPIFRDASREALRTRDLEESGISRVFNDSTIAETRPGRTRETVGERNRREMSEGMGNLFYFIASRDDAYRADAQKVERARMSLPEANQTYSALPDIFPPSPLPPAPALPPGSQYNPREIYQRLVLAGQQKALSMEGRTLGAYVFGVVGMATQGERDAEHRESDTREKLINQRINEINTHMYPASVNAGMRAVRSGNRVSVFLDNAASGVPARDFNIEEFARLSKVQILEQWHEHVLGTLRSEMENLGATPPSIPATPTLPIATLSAFHMRRAGEDIIYSEAVSFTETDLRTARTPAYQFWKQPRANIYIRYLHWKRDKEHGINRLQNPL